MKTPEQLSEQEIKKLCEQADESYRTLTPKKITHLREMEIPSRITKPMTKTALAHLTGVQSQNIGKMEKPYGDTHSLNVSLSFIQKVAIIFNIDANFLLGLTEEPRPLYEVDHKKPKSMATGDQSILKEILNEVRAIREMQETTS